MRQIHTAIQQTGFVRVKRGLRTAVVEDPLYYKDIDANTESTPTDPYFPLQWYLRNTGQNGGKVRLDLNVQEAWAQGITGKNITTAIMDDGVDYMHPDLKYNYVSLSFVMSHVDSGQKGYKERGTVDAF